MGRLGIENGQKGTWGQMIDELVENLVAEMIAVRIKAATPILN